MPFTAASINDPSMTRNFIYLKGNSRKYWSITVNRSSFTTSYGKVEYDPQTTTKKFPTEEKCQREADKLIASKLKSKYVEVPLHIPKVPVWDLWASVAARDNKETELNISAHHSTEFTRLICGLTKLKHLTVTNLKELPPAIGQLTNLRSLDISSSDKLTRIPDEIGQLKKLKFLTIRGTAIKSLPDSIGNLTQLLSLSISSNLQLEKTPAAIGRLTKLGSLYITFNRSGIAKNGKPLQLPEDLFQQLTKLNLVSLDCNSLTSLPKSLENCHSVKRLSLGFNRFREIPPAVFALKKLQHLSICDMPSLKKLSPQIVQLKQLDYLSFDEDHIRNIPEEVLQMGLPAIRKHFRTQ